MSSYSSSKLSRRQYIIQAFHKLSSEEKVIGISAFILTLSCFLPWYSGPVAGMSFQQIGSENVNFSGFSNVGFILGYLVLVCGLGSLVLFSKNLLQWKLPFDLPFNEERTYLYLGERALMFEIIALFIYTNQSFQYTQAEVRFGLYFGLIASLLMVIFGYMHHTQTKNQQEKQKLEHIIPISAVSEEEEEFWNQHDEKGTPRSFDANAYLAQHGLHRTPKSGIDSIEKAKQEVLQ